MEAGQKMLNDILKLMTLKIQYDHASIIFVVKILHVFIQYNQRCLRVGLHQGATPKKFRNRRILLVCIKLQLLVLEKNGLVDDTKIQYNQLSKHEATT